MVGQMGKDMPQPLRRVRAVYVLLMLGTAIEVAAFVAGLVLSATGADYLASTKAVRDAAQEGSPILTQLGQMKGVSAWLLPFQFLGIATLFAAIGLALSAIIKRIQLRRKVAWDGTLADGGCRWLEGERSNHSYEGHSAVRSHNRYCTSAPMARECVF